jgi:hypothetical protein
MSFELNIVVLKQEKAVPLLGFPFEAETEILDGSYSFDHWKFMHIQTGVWYSIGVYEGDFFSALQLLDTNFEPAPSWFQPYWVNQDNISNLTVLEFRDEYKNHIISAIRYFIQMSPIHMIMLMARYQGGDTENICGVISIDKFLELYNDRKILFNMSYVISSEDGV